MNEKEIKMIGLESASKSTVDWPRIGYVTVIRYDPDTGEVWASDATSDQLAGPYDICRTVRHMSANQIAGEIMRHMQMVEAI